MTRTHQSQVEQLHQSPRIRRGLFYFPKKDSVLNKKIALDIQTKSARVHRVWAATRALSVPCGRNAEKSIPSRFSCQ